MKAVLNIILTPLKMIWNIFDNDAHRIVSKKGLNLIEMEDKLDKQLAKETTESLTEFIAGKRPDDYFQCSDPNCKHCLEDIKNMEEDDLTDDEWLIREKHFDTIAFGEWLLSHDISFIDNTDKGNIYDYNGVELTMEELHEIYSKQKPK